MIDIKRFCAKNDIRLFLNSPFRLDGKVCASNGHIIIIVPDDYKNDYEELPENFRAILGTIKMIEANDQWQLLVKDSFGFPELIECKVCDGKGKAIKTDCEECCGEGVSEASNDYSTYYDLECASCEGKGYESTPHDTRICPDCYGEGTVYPMHGYVHICGENFAAKYLRLIIDEPGIQFHVDKEILFFKTPECIGAIMGMRVQEISE